MLLLLLLFLRERKKILVFFENESWYADDAGALGTFAILEVYFDSLTRQGQGREYHPKTTKSVLIVRP